jgi:methionyl-tRNA formyltransferase
MSDLGKGPERVKVLRTELTEGGGPPGALLDQRGTVACGEGAVRLVQVQRAGRPPVAAEDFLRGARIPTGALLTGAAAL